jgi:ribosomal protein L37AE/L43A
MYKKVCSRCTRSSFSSTELGDWICPSCGNDLTNSPFYASSLSVGNILPLRKKLEAYKKGMGKKYF